MTIDLRVAYNTILRWAKNVYGKNKLKLKEVFDFGDSYGFAFDNDDKYSNMYWCVSKKAAQVFLYRPNEDIKRFSRRNPISLNFVRNKL